MPEDAGLHGEASQRKHWSGTRCLRTSRRTTQCSYRTLECLGFRPSLNLPASRIRLLLAICVRHGSQLHLPAYFKKLKQKSRNMPSVQTRMSRRMMHTTPVVSSTSCKQSARSSGYDGHGKLLEAEHGRQLGFDWLGDEKPLAASMPINVDGSVCKWHRELTTKSKALVS